MNKIYLIFFATLFFPITVFSAINSLNGETGSTQTFVNDTNIVINSNSNNHTIDWSGILSPFRGGTGIDMSFFSTSSILFWNGSSISEDPSLYFDSGTFYIPSLINSADNDNAVEMNFPGGLYVDTGEQDVYFETDSGNINLNAPSGLIAIMANSLYQAVLNTSLLTNHRNINLPDFDGTFSLLEANQVWSGDNTFSKGASATTTVTFGEIGDISSKVCFNTKNTDGNDISFYFVGTSMVIENNICN